jgi:redox-sensitive bicupin YhaK (pirin superfamily)
MLTIIPRVEDVEGQPILRPLPSARCRSVGPFVFFDHMLETTYLPGTGMDIRQHPHIGLSTLTYLFEGEILHKDSLGSDQYVRPGEVSWMTSRGIACERLAVARAASVAGIAENPRTRRRPLQPSPCPDAASE